MTTAPPMSDEELEQILSDPESDLVERKSSLADRDKIGQTICAFANDLPNHGRPGVLFVGVNDNGDPTGLAITDRLLQELASMRADGNVSPFPSIDVQRRTLKGGEVAVVFVHPSAAPPVRYKGVVWIRSGPRRGVASAEDERRLNEKRRHRDLPFDIRPMPDAALAELDELLFRRVYLPAAVAPDVLERNERTLEQQLIATKFAHPGPPVSPTVLGLLTVGKTPTDWIPGAYVQFVRFDGAELADAVKNQREVRGALPELLTELEDLLKVHIETAADFTSRRTEVRTPNYPIAALQQIVRNAIMHRSFENTHAPVRVHWFNDRIEVHSPGGPFGQVTKENFGTPNANDYRNPNLAAVMKELGYVQRFGVGIALAQREMRRNGNPEIEFLVEDAHVAGILRKRP